MKPYAPKTNKGRTVGGHDIHHKSADQPKKAAKASAKAMRHAARCDGKEQSLRDQACYESAQVVKHQHRKLICDAGGHCIGYSDWRDGGGLPWWPLRTLQVASAQAGRDGDQWVMQQHQKPICDAGGHCIGYTDWRDGGGLPGWPHRNLVVASAN